MKTYMFDNGTDSFTVKCDDNGVAIESDNPSIKKAVEKADEKHIMRQIGYIRHMYESPHRGAYEVEEMRETKKSREQEDFEEFGEMGELTKFDLDKRLVFGWAYVTHTKDGEVVVDKSGEFIDDPDVLESAAYDFVIKSRVAGDSHQRDLTVGDGPRQVGTMVESMVFTPEKLEKMGIAPGTLPTGWWVGFRIDDQEVWKAVRRGERPAFSIHGKARKVEVQ